jgi:hypothetical protein
MNYNSILFIYCLRNDADCIKRILDRYIEGIDQIDVLDGDGQLLKMAISNNNFEICKALLSFFEKKQNPTQEQKEKLVEILEEVTSFSTLSKEMQLVLKNYVPYEEDSREEDFTAEEKADFQNWLTSIQDDNLEQIDSTLKPMGDIDQYLNL